MRVICAGFGRTGTSSLKGALEELLGADCYHFEELFRHSEQRQRWARFARGEEEMDWKTLFSGYEAAVDFPICAYYEELAEVFPDALILLSLREPQSWAASWTGLWSYFRFFRTPLLRFCFSWIDDISQVLETVVEQRTFAGKMDTASLVARFEAHTDEVQAKVPPERLLVYRVQEGWEPLCEALGVPVPDRPFPRNNPGNRPLLKRTIAKMFGRDWKSLTEP